MIRVGFYALRAAPAFFQGRHKNPLKYPLTRTKWRFWDDREAQIWRFWDTRERNGNFWE